METAKVSLKTVHLIVCSTFQALKDNEAAIQQEMIDIQGVPADVGGYYKLDEDKANAVMRPSKVTLWFFTISSATIS